MSACRSCGARIVWVTMIETRKAMPLDPEPADDGTIVVDWRHHAGAMAEPDDYMHPHRYRSHFATCPQASEWRRS